MRKYLETAIISFKAQIVYRFDVAMTGLATLGRVLFAWILWGVIFSGRETVGDFTLPSMLSYYLVSSFLSSLDLSAGVSREVSTRIRSGTFSKFMVIPVSPRLYFLSQTLGAAGYYALFSAIAAAMCALLFRIGLPFAADPAVFLCALAMTVLGLCFMCSYHFLIGILTFRFQGIDFFLHLQTSILSFLTGSIVPLSLLPKDVTDALQYLPFPYVNYAPTMLLTGQMGGTEGLRGLLVLALWTTGMAALCRLTYGRLRVKYDGVGI